MHYFALERPREPESGLPYIVAPNGQRQGIIPTLVLEPEGPETWQLRCHVHVGGSAYRERSATFTLPLVAPFLALYEADPEEALRRLGWSPEMWEPGRSGAVRREASKTTLADLGLEDL